MYDHEPTEVAELGWAEFVSRQWDAIFTGYRAGRGRRTLCRCWADLFEGGLGCPQQLADLLVRSQVLDREDRDLEGTHHPDALVAGMAQLIADARAELPPDPALLDRHAELLAFLRDYAALPEGSETGTS